MLSIVANTVRTRNLIRLAVLTIAAAFTVLSPSVTSAVDETDCKDCGYCWIPNPIPPEYGSEVPCCHAVTAGAQECFAGGSSCTESGGICPKPEPSPNASLQRRPE